MDWQRKQNCHSWRFSYIGGSNREDEEENTASGYPLSQAVAGSRVTLIGFKGRTRMNQWSEMGLTLGMELEVVSRQPSGSVVVNSNNRQIGIGAEEAHKIFVSKSKMTEENPVKTFLREMPEGTRCRIVGYDKTRWGYQGKLVSRGLIPGAEFTVLHQGVNSEPIEILCQGVHLSLTKPEADALVVETVDLDD